jgi:hypothetical protein
MNIYILHNRFNEVMKIHFKTKIRLFVLLRNHCSQNENSPLKASQGGSPKPGGHAATGTCDSIQTGVGRDTPTVRILPIKLTSQGASISGIPPQGASSSSKPMEGASQQFWHTTAGS